MVQDSPSIERAGPLLSGRLRAQSLHDVGLMVDLTRAGDALKLPYQRERPKGTHQGATLSWSEPAPTVSLHGVPTDPTAHYALYSQGVLTVALDLPVQGAPKTWRALAEAARSSPELEKATSELATSVFERIHPAIHAPSLSHISERAVISIPDAATAADTLAALAAAGDQDLADWIALEDQPLTAKAAADTLAQRFERWRGEFIWVHESASLIVSSKRAPELLALLERAHLAKLELRVLERKLDDALSDARAALSRMGTRRRLWPSFHDRRVLLEFVEDQIDCSLLYEGAQYATRLAFDRADFAALHRFIVERQALEVFAARAQRKLSILEGLIARMTELRATQRMEILEVTIVILIALSMVLPWIAPGAK